MSANEKLAARKKIVQCLAKITKPPSNSFYFHTLKRLLNSIDLHTFDAEIDRTRILAMKVVGKEDRLSVEILKLIKLSAEK